MATVPGLFAASVMVNCSFRRLVDRPRLPPRPVVPTRVQRVHQVLATGGASLGAGGGALAITAKRASGGGRRSAVCVASAHGVSSALLLLPDGTANTLASAGELSFFGAGTANLISSVPLAAGGRASRGRVIVAAKGSSPGDGKDDDDSTKVKDEQVIEDYKKYMVAPPPPDSVAQSGNTYQYWLKRKVDGVEQQEVTMYTTAGDVILKVVSDFNPEVVVSETFLVCKEKVVVDFFGRVLICGAKLFEDLMRTRPPTSENHEALVSIGKKLKVAALECQNGSLQSKTLDTWIEVIMRLRATALGVPEDYLRRPDIRARLPEKPDRIS